MKVISLFDGISCAQHALKKLTNKYQWYSSEIDKTAIDVVDYWFRDTFQLGCIETNFPTIAGITNVDFIVAGSPCQGFSFAGKQLNFNDPRSKLFFEFVRVLAVVKPKYFLLENVKMKKEYSDVITAELKKIYPDTRMVEFNSEMVSPQKRNRLYWTNFKWDHEVDHYNETTLQKTFLHAENFFNYSSSGRGNGRIEGRFSIAEKALTLTASGYSQRAKTFTEGKEIVVTAHEETLYKLIPNLDDIYFKRRNTIDFMSGVRSYRDLDAWELALIQGLPMQLFQELDIKPSKQIHLIGNGMEVNTIEHIIRTGIF